jgi:putative membrane-bound dehydrogenase-like protein
MYSTLPFLLLAVATIGCSSNVPRYPGPLSPEEALSTFDLVPGFSIEVFAAEPDVLDPVELVFDANGTAYVVEMPDYPFPPAPGEGRGRLVRLDDTDGDRRIDRRTVFADGLSEATSALPWKEGFLVAAAPDIAYLADTDGDGRSDRRDLLFTGFFQGNSEAQITNLRLSPDSWFYASNFGQEGSIRSPAAPEAPSVGVRGTDFRFRLDPPRFEPAAGAAQFGQAIDPWGQRFGTQNTTHLLQFVLPWRYLHRHPHLASPGSSADISGHDRRVYPRSPVPYWRAERTARRQAAFDSAGMGQVEIASGFFTGASGGTLYDGDLFPARFRGSVFTGDVAGNLVHRDSLAAGAGPLFVAHRPAGETDREFLTSTDPWFRPVQFTVGPEGALYVVDMYRQHIESPLSIPEDLKAEMDFAAGSDRGRIYRIVPEGTTHRPQTRGLADAPVDTLVNTLGHTNGWQRQTAQRLLLERLADADVADRLRQALAAESGPARFLGLTLLDAAGALREADVRTALADPVPGVRRLAVRLTESFPGLAPVALTALLDPDPAVALQAALTAGQQRGRAARHGLAAFVVARGGDRWMRLAVLSAPSGASLDMLDALERLGYFGVPSEPAAAFLRETADVLARRGGPAELNRFVDFLVDHPEPFWLEAGFTGLRDGHRAGAPLPLDARAVDNIQAFIRSSSEIVQQLAGDILALTAP